MKSNAIQLLKYRFDALSQIIPEESVEFWFARDLMEPLGYARWENFQTAISRAIESCETTGYPVEDHFRGVTKMVKLGSGAERSIDDFMLTRYACYLIAQNGDPRKEPIAFAQSYFAIQTRKQELIEDRMRLQARLDARERLRESEKTLSQNIYERGVDDNGLGRIRSKGDAALFGGHTTQAMKDRFSMPANRLAYLKQTHKSTPTKSAGLSMSALMSSVKTNLHYLIATIAVLNSTLLTGVELFPEIGAMSNFCKSLK